jgi:hypothetical protein
MARHENTRSRRVGGRSKRVSNLLVYCASEKTEFDYFVGLRDARNVAIKPKAKRGSPLAVVNHAADEFGQYPGEYEAVWCVVDVDDFDIEAARKAAAQRGVEVAVSNPCFEVWLLLHFVDHRAFVSNAAAATALVRGHVPGYVKAVDFTKFAGGVDQAVARAKRLASGNPSTEVWRLVEAALTR